MPPDWDRYTGEELVLPRSNISQYLEAALIDSIQLMKQLVRPYTPEYRLWCVSPEWRMLLRSEGFKSISSCRLFGIPVILDTEIKDLYLLHEVARKYVRLRVEVAKFG